MLLAPRTSPASSSAAHRARIVARSSANAAAVRCRSASLSGSLRSVNACFASRLLSTPARMSLALNDDPPFLFFPPFTPAAASAASRSAMKSFRGVSNAFVADGSALSASVAAPSSAST